MEEVMVSMEVDGWEIYVKETRPKGQRLPNEVDPEKVALHYDYVPKTDASVACNLTPRTSHRHLSVVQCIPSK
jgi:hypothetical protein